MENQPVVPEEEKMEYDGLEMVWVPYGKETAAILDNILFGDCHEVNSEDFTPRKLNSDELTPYLDI